MENESHGSWPSGGIQDDFSPAKKGSNSNNKEQDRFLPIANVGRIMKKVIPGNGKISKDAKETVQECVSEFISFVTGEASDKCQREKRKTINGDDVIWAITTLGFEDYVVPLKVYLNKYREIEGDKLNVPNKQRPDQESQQQQLNEQNTATSLPYIDHPHPHSVYSSSNFITPQTFLTADQQFPLPFSPTSVQKQIQQEQHIDSVGHW
uniref:Transcription factor CBF/NF-Y/archaeal histone domain-containing protein n=1 Tax=Kalanchoe fedtschenkoi TaxID=63787 RepID=A0A7N0V095_KALFE